MRVDRDPRATGQAPRITELWAWTVVDPLTDTEGIVAGKEPVRFPFVGATKELVARFEPFAQQIAREVDAPVRLRRFGADNAGEAIICPHCLRTSWNPNDVREGYCGNCHEWKERWS